MWLHPGRSDPPVSPIIHSHINNRSRNISAKRALSFQADGNGLIRVSLSLNTAARSLDFDRSIRAIAPHAADSIFVSTSGQTRIVLDIAPGLTASLSALYQEANCLSMVPNKEYSAAVIDGEIGIVSYHMNEDSTKYSCWLYSNRPSTFLSVILFFYYD